MSALPQATPELILLRSEANGVATLTLNRPAQRNALSTALMAALQAELDAIANDRTVRVVIIAANGPAFSGGHDLKEMRANPGREFQEALFAQCGKLMMSIVRLPQPVIAKIHAPAAAAGCQLVATCDLAVTVDTATFSTPGVNIGLFCSTPMVALTRAAPRKAAMEMLLTGEVIDAAHAVKIGLVNRIAPAAGLDAAVTDLVKPLLAKSPRILRIGKEAFYRQIEMDLAEAYAYAGRVMVENMMISDTQSGIDAFIAKRPPQWTES
ncbi:MAG: enoyl-CoA hydratase [Alphaproteobacteria bacterium]|nr:enoyl-CoA hydratase [Alphaproteobacteria bacterium]